MLEWICIFMEIINLPFGYILSHMVHLNTYAILVTCFVLGLYYLCYKIHYIDHTLFLLLENHAYYVHYCKLVIPWEFQSTLGNFSYWHDTPKCQKLHLYFYNFAKKYVEAHTIISLTIHQRSFRRLRICILGMNYWPFEWNGRK